MLDDDLDYLELVSAQVRDTSRKSVHQIYMPCRYRGIEANVATRAGRRVSECVTLLSGKPEQN
jgi:hypothetical protein